MCELAKRFADERIALNAAGWDREHRFPRELATNHAKERHAFGRPIARFQAVQHRLADMQTEIEAARALVWRAARLKDAGRPHTVEGVPTKLFASRVARHQRFVIA